LKEGGRGEGGAGGEGECKNVCSAQTPANRSQQIEQHGRQHSSKQKQMSASKDRNTHTDTGPLPGKTGEREATSRRGNNFKRSLCFLAVVFCAPTPTTPLSCHSTFRSLHPSRSSLCVAVPAWGAN
jgi:hypothetical protein